METITSRNNEKIKLAAALMTSADKRKQTGLFLLEGARLCIDAVKSKMEIECLLLSKEASDRFREEALIISKTAHSVYRITDELAHKISDTKHTQGIFCVCKMLDKTEDMDKIDYNGKYIALEDISNPLNLGSICRSAEAFGLSGIIIGGGCDIYNPKAQRAAMGSLLRFPVINTDNLPRLFTLLAEKGMKTFAAVLDDDAVSIKDIDFTGASICAVGNEGAGLKAETVNAIQKKITISMKGAAESLNANAAAAVIMWEMMR